MSPATRIHLAAGATDLRQSFEGLSDRVTQGFQQDPLGCHLFLFVTRRMSRLQVLCGDGTDVWVCAKRLGSGPLPGRRPPDALQILAAELTVLLSGIAPDRTQTRPWWRPALSV